MSTSNPPSSTPAGTHAIVYGGGMAGMMSAGILSRHFVRPEGRADPGAEAAGRL